MKKTIRIAMYLDCTNEWGDRCWNYVCTVRGDHIELGTHLWYLRDSDGKLICCGELSKLHGDGTSEFDVKFKSVVSY